MRKLIPILVLLLATTARGQGGISGAGAIGCTNTPTQAGSAITSATGTGVTYTTPYLACAQLNLTLDQTTTITGGAITVQQDPGDGNFVNLDSWRLVDPTTPPFATIGNPYSFQASTNKQFYIYAHGLARIRLNLTSALTGTGSVTPFITPTSLALPIVFQATNSNLNVSATFPSAQSVNVAQVAGSSVSTAASGVMKVGVVGNTGVALDAATGAAPPANALLHAGLGSGATGGFLVGVPVGDTYKSINISTATTTLIVTGVSGRQVRITAQHLITAAANNVAWIEGTGATCGTGTAGMAGGTTAASGYNFAANGGIAQGSGQGTVLQTVTPGDSVCLVTSAAAQLSGGIEYTIF